MAAADVGRQRDLQRRHQHDVNKALGISAAMLERADEIVTSEAQQRQQQWVAFQRGMYRVVEHELAREQRRRELRDAQRDEQQQALLVQNVEQQKLRARRLNMNYRKEIMRTWQAEQLERQRRLEASDAGAHERNVQREAVEEDERERRHHRRESIVQHHARHVENIKRYRMQRKEHDASKEQQLQRAFAAAEHHQQLDTLTRSMRRDEDTRRLAAAVTSSTRFHEKRTMRAEDRADERARSHLIRAFVKEKHMQLRKLLEMYSQWEVENRNYVGVLYLNSVRRVAPPGDEFDTEPLQPPKDWRDARKEYRQTRHMKHVQARRDAYHAAKRSLVQSTREDQQRLQALRDENAARFEERKQEIRANVNQTRGRLEALKVAKSPAASTSVRTPKAGAGDGTAATSPCASPQAQYTADNDVDNGAGNGGAPGSPLQVPPTSPGARDNTNTRQEAEGGSSVDHDNAQTQGQSGPTDDADGQPLAAAAQCATPQRGRGSAGTVLATRRARRAEDRHQRLARVAEVDAAAFEVHKARQRELQRQELEEARKRREEIEHNRRVYVANLNKHKAVQAAAAADVREASVRPRAMAMTLTHTPNTQAPAPSSLLLGGTAPPPQTRPAHADGDSPQGAATRKELPRPWWEAPTVHHSPFKLTPHDPYLSGSVSQAAAVQLDKSVKLFSDVDRDLMMLDLKSRKLALAL